MSSSVKPMYTYEEEKKYIPSSSYSKDTYAYKSTYGSSSNDWL